MRKDWNNRQHVLSSLAEARRNRDTAAVKRFSARLNELTPKRDMNNADDVRMAFLDAKALGDDSAMQRFGGTLERLEREAVNPTSGMGTLSRLAAGIGSSVAQTGRGLGQLVGLYDDAEIQEAADRDRALLDTGAGLTGNIGGHIAQVLIPATGALRVAKGAGAAASATRALASAVLAPKNVAAAAGVSGLYAGAQPVLQDETRLGNAFAGAAAGAAGYGLGKAVGAVATRATPAQRQALREAQAADILMKVATDKDAARQAIQNAAMRRPAVPGTRQTIAEITDDTGLVGLERMLTQARPSFRDAYTAQQGMNNTARVNAIRQAFGGADEAAADAIEQQTRQSAVPLLNQARQQSGVNTRRVASLTDRLVRDRKGREGVTRTLSSVRALFEEPVDEAVRARNAVRLIDDVKGSRMSSADFDMLRQAQTLIRRGDFEGLAAFKPSSVTAQRTIKEARRLLAADSRMVDDVHTLYNVRQHIGDLLSGKAGGDSDVAKAAARELMTVKKALDGEIRKVAPEFGDYLKRYAGGMREAGQVRMGAALLDRSKAALDASGNPVLLPAQFSRAADDLDRVAQQATGFRKARADRLMTPDQRQTTEAIRGQLDAFARAQSKGAPPGSRTAQNLFDGARLQEQMGGNELVGLVGGERANAILNIVNRARAAGGERVAEVVEQAMLDPQRAAQLLANLTPQQRRVAVGILGPALAAPTSTALTNQR